MSRVVGFMMTSVLLAACGTDSPSAVVKSDPPADIRVIETIGGPDDDPAKWPSCFGASGHGCISRIIAPCEEVEIAYTFAHDKVQKHLKPFTAEHGEMVDQEGRKLTPSDIVGIAKQEEQVIDETTALAGNKPTLVGYYTERNEIDVFHSGHVGLDYVKCTDRESTFETEEAEDAPF